MPKRTFQPKKLRRLKRLGFRARNKKSTGKNVLKRRLTKGRKKLTVSDEYRILKKKPTDRNR